ncbi:MAG: hypothetical protein HKN20_00125 [Gemmatimonadetes bacterium]|nr:hypothetical protein [Gemmatimonadota bacterium]
MSSRFAAALEAIVSNWEEAAESSAVLSVNRKMGILEGDEDALLDVVRALLDRFRAGGAATSRGVEIQAFRRADQVLLIVSREGGNVHASDGETPNGPGVETGGPVWSDDVLPAGVRLDLDAIGARVHWTREGNDRLQCMVKLGR